MRNRACTSFLDNLSGNFSNFFTNFRENLRNNLHNILADNLGENFFFNFLFQFFLLEFLGKELFIQNSHGLNHVQTYVPLNVQLLARISHGNPFTVSRKVRTISVKNLVICSSKFLYLLFALFQQETAGFKAAFLVAYFLNEFLLRVENSLKSISRLQ